ncbi:MAG: succinate dehydrogenase [Pseudomonadota bacterium]
MALRARIGRTALLIAAPALLMGCVAAQNAADAVAREQARTFVDAEVQRRAPGVDARPLTNCVINEASAQEIVTIAGGTAIGNEQLASQTVGAILQRPGTQQCLTGNIFSELFGGLGL